MATEFDLKTLHTFLKLSEEGEVEGIRFVGSEGSDSSSLLIPGLDGDEVVLYDYQADATIRLSDSTKRLICSRVDNYLNL